MINRACVKMKGELYCILYFPQNSRGRYFPKQKNWNVRGLGVRLKAKEGARKAAWMSKLQVTLFSLCNIGFGFLLGVAENDVKELICGNPLFTYSLATLPTG